MFYRRHHRRCGYSVALRRVLANIFAVQKLISITFCDNMTHTLSMRVRHIVIRVLPVCMFCPHYVINETIEKKSYWTQNVRLIFFQHFLSETFLIVRRNERDMIEIIYWYSCKVPVFKERHPRCFLPYTNTNNCSVLYLYSFSDKLYPTWWWPQQHWPKHVDKLYTSDNIVVWWLLYPYRIITLGSNKHNGDDTS